MNKFILTVGITMAVFTASNAACNTREVQTEAMKCITSELGDWPMTKCAISENNTTPSTCNALNGCKHNQTTKLCDPDGSASTYNQAKACKELSGLRACFLKLGCWPSLTTTRYGRNVVLNYKSIYCTSLLTRPDSPGKGCPTSTCNGDGAAAVACGKIKTNGCVQMTDPKATGEYIPDTAATTITSSPIAFVAALVVAAAMAR